MALFDLIMLILVVKFIFEMILTLELLYANKSSLLIC